MAYNPTVWVDKETPVNAENLNKMEQAVQANNTAINEINTARENGEFKGDKGDKGDPGTSVTHSWNGTTLTIISASGTSSANLKGDKGDTGATGPAYTLTATDKSAIVNAVIAALPVYNGEVV